MSKAKKAKVEESSTEKSEHIQQIDSDDEGRDTIHMHDVFTPKWEAIYDTVDESTRKHYYKFYQIQWIAVQRRRVAFYAKKLINGFSKRIVLV